MESLLEQATRNISNQNQDVLATWVVEIRVYLCNATDLQMSPCLPVSTYHVCTILQMQRRT